MKYALVNDSKIEATKAVKGFCPACGSELVAKMGDKIMHHWAHKGNRNCDHWWENETGWHRMWKNHFPVAWQEVVHFDETGEKHIADVKTNEGVIVEFQHSYLKPEERISRNKFYKKIIWIVDGSRRPTDLTKLNKVVDLGFTYESKSFSFMHTDYPEDSRLLKDWNNTGVPIFLDFAIDLLYLILPINTNDCATLVPISKVDIITQLLDNGFEEFLKTLFLDFNIYHKENGYQFEQSRQRLLLKNLKYNRDKFNRNYNKTRLF